MVYFAHLAVPQIRLHRGFQEFIGFLAGKIDSFFPVYMQITAFNLPGRIIPGQIAQHRVVRIVIEGVILPHQAVRFAVNPRSAGQFVAAADGLSVLQPVTQIHAVKPDVVVLHGQLRLGPAIQDLLMQRQSLFDHARIRDVGFSIGQVHGLHLFRQGNIAAVAEHIQPDTEHGSRNDHAGHRPVDPVALAEYPDGFMEHHLSHKVAQERACQHAQQHRHKIPRSNAADQHLRQQVPQHQTAANGEAIEEHRLQVSHGNDISGGFHSPAPEEPEGQGREGHACGSQNQQMLPALKIAVRHDRLIPDASNPRRSFAQGVIQRRGPGKPEVSVEPHAVDKALQQLADQGFYHNGREIQHHIQPRQRSHMAHNHGQQHGKAVVKHKGQALGSQPDGQLRSHKHPPQQARQQAQQRHQQVGANGQQQAGQIAGDKQIFPPQGQGAEEIGAAAVIEERERHAGRREPIDKGHKMAGVGRRLQNKLPQLQQRFPPVPG